MGLQNLAESSLQAPYVLSERLTGLINARKDVFPWVFFLGPNVAHARAVLHVELRHSRAFRAMAGPSGPIDLLGLVKDWKQEGMHLGFYGAPYSEETPKSLTRGSTRDFLAGWFVAHRTQHGANAYYVDVIARDSFGRRSTSPSSFSLPRAAWLPAIARNVTLRRGVLP